MYETQRFSRDRPIVAEIIIVTEGNARAANVDYPFITIAVTIAL